MKQATAVEVRVQHRLKYVCLLTYDPFEAVFSKNYHFKYKFNIVSCNVNPRLVFFTYKEKRKQAAEIAAAAATTATAKEKDKDEKYDPRSLALKMDGGRLKAVAFKSKSTYWRREDQDKVKNKSRAKVGQNMIKNYFLR